MELRDILKDEESAKSVYYQAQAELLERSFREFTYAAFSQSMGGELKNNWHIDMLTDVLQAWVEGAIPYLMINLPPRVLKSVLVSVLLNPWAWIRNPWWKWIFASYSDKLALRDARISKKLMQSNWYMNRFAGKVMIAQGAQAVGDYHTTQRGRRLTMTPKSKTTGEGGHAQVVDDLHNVKDVESPKTRRNTLMWHDDAFWNRYEDPNDHRRLYVGQRTHMSDIYGHVMAMHGDDFVHVNVPMEYVPKLYTRLVLKDGDDERVLFDDPREEDGELLHPERLSPRVLAQDRRTLSEGQYQAQYQQMPQGDGGLIIKRKHWLPWEWPEGHREFGKPRPLPVCHEVFQVYDTAFEEEEENDCSARTTWGLFENTDPDYRGEFCMIMLDRFNERVTMPDLVKEMVKSKNAMEPDKILIEKKASGHSLIQFGRKKRLPVKGIRQKKGKQLSKLAKAHYASLAFEQSRVFYVPRPWAYEVIDQTCAFPQDDHDDMADTVFMAAAYCLNRNKLDLGDKDVDVFISRDTDSLIPGYGL